MRNVLIAFVALVLIGYSYKTYQYHNSKEEFDKISEYVSFGNCIAPIENTVDGYSMMKQPVCN